jgi:hypothetical protein
MCKWICVWKLPTQAGNSSHGRRLITSQGIRYLICIALIRVNYIDDVYTSGIYDIYTTIVVLHVYADLLRLTFAPCFRSASQTALPIPWAPPVTKATFPVNLDIVQRLCGLKSTLTRACANSRAWARAALSSAVYEFGTRMYTYTHSRPVYRAR